MHADDVSVLVLSCVVTGTSTTSLKPFTFSEINSKLKQARSIMTEEKERSLLTLHDKVPKPKKCLGIQNILLLWVQSILLEALSH